MILWLLSFNLRSAALIGIVRVVAGFVLIINLVSNDSTNSNFVVAHSEESALELAPRSGDQSSCQQFRYYASAKVILFQAFF